MTKRLIVPILAAVLSLALCFLGKTSAAPVVSPWELMQSKIVYSDTLGMLASDSVATTDSIFVFGARAVVLIATSSGAAGTGLFNGGTGIAFDSIAVPIVQTNFTPGQWSGTGGGAQIPYSGGNVAIANTATTLISTTTRMVWLFTNETSLAGSTPVPLINGMWRWRLKSTNARRYSAGDHALNQGTLSPTGRITVQAFVLR